MSWILITIYALNFLTIMAILFIERKKPSTAFSWILLLTFLPVVGFIFYPILGRNLRPNEKKSFRLKMEFDNLYNKRLQKEHPILNNANYRYSFDHEALIKMNISAGNSVYSEDNEIAVFTRGRDKFSSLFKDIEEAKDSINMLYYIINNDKLGREVVKLLARKAKEGVEVRVLYDHIGSIFTPHKMFDELISAGGKVYRFSPVRLVTYTRINFRNHRKIVVIDGRIGYTGGMNVGDEYLGMHKRINPWRDTHLRITGSAVYALQERFLMDWSYASKNNKGQDADELTKFFPPIQPTGSIGMQVLSSGPDINGEQIKRAYIKMINSAKESILIQTPYFIPDDSFLEALKIAALSGVDIKIMLPGVPDKTLVYRATTSYIKDLLECGAKVYLYAGFLHSKMLVVDGKVVSIGTANMDVRSFSSNFEINTFIYDSEFSSKCSYIFEKDLARSKQLTNEFYDKRGLIIKMQEGLCRLLSPFL
jgi:cardiolipin synthase A/B